MENRHIQSIPPIQIKCYELVLINELKKEYEEYKQEKIREIIRELKDEFKLLKQIQQ